MMRADEERIDLQPFLTPRSDDLSPRGEFSTLQNILNDEKLDKRVRKFKLKKFASLSEEAARRTAVELNFLMRAASDTPPPSKIANELGEVAQLADKLALALRALHGVSVAALTGTEDPTSPYLALPRGSGSGKLNNRRTPKFKTAFGPELRLLELIDERAISAARSTKDKEQIDLLDRYDRAMADRSTREQILDPDRSWVDRPWSCNSDRYNR